MKLNSKQTGIIEQLKNINVMDAKPLIKMVKVPPRLILYVNLRHSWTIIVISGLKQSNFLLKSETNIHEMYSIYSKVQNN